MKKTIVPILCLVLLLSLASCTPRQEKKVMDYYQVHAEELKEAMEDHFQNGVPLSPPSGSVTMREWIGKHTIVEYTATGKGIASASVYCGFFYSVDDVPVSFQNSGETLIQTSDNEWEWKGDGDNHGLIRRIEPHWYYFEAAY